MQQKQTDDDAHRWLREEIASLLRHFDDVDRPLPASAGIGAAPSVAAE